VKKGTADRKTKWNEGIKNGRNQEREEGIKEGRQDAFERRS
jgi:hypothetical protein